jgi:endonuclease-3
MIKSTDDESLGSWLIERLRNRYDIAKFGFISSFIRKGDRNPFKILVATILSQNSTDKAAMAAYSNLEKIVDISPSSIAKLDSKVIASAIKPAGLHRSKAEAIKKLSKIIITKFDGDLSNLLKKDIIDARRELMKLPKVGPKTSDVLLVSMGVLKTVPVDTHISRIAKRFGLVPLKADYEAIRKRLDYIFSEDDRYDAHLLLILHGRETCRAINPLCNECVINERCAYYKSCE